MPYTRRNKSTFLQIEIYLLLFFSGINRMNSPSDAHGRHRTLRNCTTTDDNADIAAIFSVVHRDWHIACFVVCSESVVHILLIH